MLGRGPRPWQVWGFAERLSAPPSVKRFSNESDKVKTEATRPLREEEVAPVRVACLCRPSPTLRAGRCQPLGPFLGQLSGVCGLRLRGLGPGAWARPADRRLLSIWECIAWPLSPASGVGSPGGAVSTGAVELADSWRGHRCVWSLRPGRGLCRVTRRAGRRARRPGRVALWGVGSQQAAPACCGRAAAREWGSLGC